jgi:MFS family permease
LETPDSSLSSLVEHNTMETNLAEKPVMPYEWEPRTVESEPHEKSDQRHDGYERLHFRPRLLRPASLGALITLCIIMIVLLIISAVFSITQQGLIPFQHLYGGLYFLFRVLPQLLACIILVFAQCTITVVYRILPFVHLHSDVREERYGAIFEDLYPRSFLWPCFIGPWQVRLAILAAWLANFTLPLQSAAFSVVLNNGVWKWTAVQGVVWTLVVLYLLLAVSLAVLMAYWLRRQDTGLLWDARSIADIIALVADTNVAADYHGTDKLGSRDRIRWTLRRRVFDRLGYWGWRDQRPGFWYTMGSSMTDQNYFPREASLDAEKASPYGGSMWQRGTPAASKMESVEEQADRDLEASVHAPSLRYRYLPWCLRSAQLICFLITALVLFVALLVVSFLPSTNILLGFLPLVPAAPIRGSFSAANFLYSFLPSLLGLAMFLLFRALDQSLQVLQPWAALSDRKRGASTKASILADYAASLPLESTLRATAHRHWRLAIISALSTLFVLIPVLAGGIFMAATTDAGDVRMFPNLALFGLVLALVLLYILGLALMLPRRKRFRLPHGVTCLAEIISFLANEDLLTDPAFKRCRSRRELLGKLGVGRDPRDQPRWVFGISGGDRAQGGVANLSLGVRRMRRFTEKRVAQRMARRMGGSRRVGKRASDLQLRPAR